MVYWGDYAAERAETFLHSCREYGTPQYILDEEELGRSCAEVTSAFSGRYPRCRFYYPYKTNSVPRLLEIIRGRGVGAEVSSLIELQLASRLGVKSVVFNSPGKTAGELEYAMKESAAVIVDNLDELGRVKAAADSAGRKPVLGVRLNLGGSKSGGWSRFGVSLNEMPALLEELGRMGLTLSGLHFHLGSGFTSAEPYEKALSRVGESLRGRLFEDVRDGLRFIDVGGGMGAGGSQRKDLADHAFKFLEKSTGYGGLSPLRDYSYDEAENVQSFADRICSAFRREVVPVLGEAELWVEPGRRLVNTCVHMLSTVLSVKGGGVVLDGGINLLPNALHENYPVVNLSRLSTAKTKTAVYGPLCMSNDKISGQMFGGKPEKGDVLCVMNVGAYNISWSQPFIKPLARIVSMSGKGLTEVRREEDLDYRVGRDAGL